MRITKARVFLAKKSQVGSRTKNIDIRTHFLWKMAEEEDINIQYIRIEENPADIMTKNILEEDFMRHMGRIIEGELWEIVYTGRENVKKTGATDDVITREKVEYSSHALAEVL